MEVIDVRTRPDLRQFVDELRARKRPLLLKDADEEIARIMPVRPSYTRFPRGKAVTLDDPLFQLIGIGRSGIPGGVSGKKHEYLAKAIRSHSR